MYSQITKLTNRKFYNKWLYKVTLRCEGCEILRYLSLNEVLDFCKKNIHKDINPHFHVWRRAINNKETIQQVCEFLAVYPCDTYNLRIEQSSIDIYTNDKDFYEKASYQCLGLIIHRFEPSEENLEILTKENHCIAVSKLPKNRYNFRVYLLPHKMQKGSDEKQKVLDWMINQSPKITCTPSIQKWFLETDWNWDRRYVLVEDEPTLLMLKLRGADIVGRIYKFVVYDK